MADAAGKLLEGHEMRQLEVTACYAIRGTDANGNDWFHREFIWPSCDSAGHRRYIKLKQTRKAERQNKGGWNVVVVYQELGEDGLWKDSIDEAASIR